MTNWTRLSDLKLLFITGKGGTGKTLFSAAFAKEQAALGKKVLLVESTSLEQLPLLFGHDQTIGHREEEIADNISCINLNLRDSFREYVADHLGMAKLYEKVFDRAIVRSFLEALPGLGEVMLLGRLYHTCELRDRYDLVIFDAPATGHFTNLLGTLDSVLNSGLIGPLVAEVSRVKEFLANPKRCGVVFMSLPEPLVINESLDFVEKMQKLVPVQIVQVFLNRIYSDLAQRLSDLELENRKIPEQVCSYLRQKLTKMQISQGALSVGLEALPLRVDLGFLPEMGVIGKELTPDFVRKFLRI